MKVLVGVDGGAQQRDALAFADHLAAPDDGAIVVVHAYPWSRWAENLGNAFELTVRQDAEAVLAEARRALGDGPGVASRAVADVSAPRALHHVAEQLGVDVIVVGSCHRGPLGRAVFGSTADRVATGAPCAVAIAPRGYADERGHGMRAIGVGYDGSPDSKVALRWAGALAQRTGAPLRVVGVVEPAAAGLYPSAAAYGYAVLIEELTKCRKAAVEEALAAVPPGVVATGRVKDGPVARVLADEAEDLDLVVVGSRGYGPLGRLLLGSTSRAVVHTAQTPVVVVPRTTVDGDADPAADTGLATTAAS